MAEEEVLVLLVFVSAEIEFGLLRPARDSDGLRGTLFPGSHRRDKQVTELELRLHTEQTLATRNQGAVQREGDVTEFNQLQNVIFLTVVFEFDLVCLGGGYGQFISGVVQVELDFVTDFGQQVQLDILVKVKLQILSLFNGNIEIVSLGEFDAQFQPDVSRRSNVYRVTAEDALKNITSDVQLRDQAATGAGFRSAPDTTALVLPVVVDALLQVVVDVLIDIHVCTRSERGVTGHVLEIVRIGYRVVDDRRSDARRILEVERVI